MLDLFSGLGGASQAMKDRGWEVIRVDNNYKFSPDICLDVRELNGYKFRNAVDLLWASPPCDEFSREGMPWHKTGREPDFSCVNAIYTLRHIIHPRWWVLENTRFAQKWLGRSGMHYGAFYLWGDFPLFLCRPRSQKWHLSSSQHELRAKIPYDLSLALALACEAYSTVEPRGGHPAGSSGVP